MQRSHGCGDDLPVLIIFAAGFQLSDCCSTYISAALTPTGSVCPGCKPYQLCLCYCLLCLNTTRNFLNSFIILLSTVVKLFFQNVIQSLTCFPTTSPHRQSSPTFKLDSLLYFKMNKCAICFLGTVGNLHHKSSRSLKNSLTDLAFKRISL